jgi:hypothetical protein
MRGKVNNNTTAYDSNGNATLISSGVYNVGDANKFWVTLQVAGNWVAVERNNVWLMEQTEAEKKTLGIGFGSGNKNANGIGFGEGDGKGDYSKWYIIGGLVLLILILK